MRLAGYPDGTPEIDVCAGVRQYARDPPPAPAWIASACTRLWSSFASAALIIRWRSSRLFPRKASDTI